MYLLLAANPFIDAYVQSDLLGKLIIIALLLLSVLTWTIIIYKVRLTRKSRKLSARFHKVYATQRQHPLSIECDLKPGESLVNPFKAIYSVLKKHTIDLLNKNRRFSEQKEGSFLSPTDIDFVEAHLSTAVSHQIKHLEQYTYLLPMTASLAPFLGLLGTVWGIIMSFSHMQGAGSLSGQMVIGGLSLALATTVLGLVDAIPALIGHSYLKNEIRDFETDMEGFATDILASVELQYRQVDLN